MQTSRIQQLIAKSLVNDLSRKIQTEVRIGDVEYQFFNNLSLKDVYIADLNGDTLLNIESIHANFNFFQFFKGKIVFNHAEIDGLHTNIIIDSEGKNNYSFLIEAFSSPHPKETSSEFEYIVEQFILKNTDIRIINNEKQHKSKNLSSDLINFNNLYFQDISADISVDVFNKDTFSLNIHNIAGKEISGFELTGFKAGIFGSSKGVNIPDINIELPESNLHIEDIAFTFDSLPDLKDFRKKVYVNAVLSNSVLTLRDLSAFIPEFKNMSASISLEAQLSGNIANLNLKNIGIKYGNTFRFNASLSLNGLPDLNETFVYGNIRELKLNGHDLGNFMSDILQESFKLPDEINKLGIVNYTGNISGFFSELVLYGSLRTDIGNVSTDILVQFENDFRDLKYDGTLKSEGLDLGRLLSSEKTGTMSFYFNTAGSHKMNSPITGIIDANIPHIFLNGYTYNDIQFNGKYDGSGFNGNLSIEDENINASFNGIIDLTNELPLFDFELIVKQINLKALNLISDLSEISLAFDAKTNMTGNSLDNINGFISFENTNITNGDKTLETGKISFISHTKKDYTNFAIESDYLNGSFSGNFKYSSLYETITEVLHQYLPVLEKNNNAKSIKNRIDVDLTIENTEKISDILNIPYAIGGTSTIKGYLDEDENIIDVVTSVPKFSTPQQNLTNIMVHFWGKEDRLEVILESNIPTQNDFWNFSLYSAAQHNKLSANIEWRNKQKIVNRGEFKTSTEFFRDENNNIASAITSILPSEIVISDMLWNINESSIDFLTDKSILIHDFRFGNDDQYLSIDGIASKNEQDSIMLEMKEINLDMVSTLANMTGFRIGGYATGKAVLYSILEKPVFNATISVQDLEFNRSRMGDASVFATWDPINKQVIAIAEINDNGQKVALGECTYLPESNRIDINIDAQWVNIDFLSKYYEKVLPNTKGHATGDLYIGGPLGEIRFSGNLLVSEGEITVGVLGSKFYLNDSVILTPTSIEFPKIVLHDQDNNKVDLNGSLTHNGNFKNFNYNLSVQAKNALIMDLKPGETSFFFGKAYADADVRISGNDDLVNIRVDAITRAGTKAYFQTLNTSSATEAGFIHFLQPDDTEEEFFTVKKSPLISETASNLILNFQLEVTPDADIEYIIDPVGGDMISGKGSGNIQVEYDNSQSDVKMYGSFVIDNGNYLFTLQDVFRKSFKIESGSSIQWAGNPSNAQVNIKAIYSVTASLKDLVDEELLESAISSGGRTSVPVNCILILTDNLLTPTVQFQIDLPQSDEAVKQLVRNAINTEEMMMNQILYLLLFNKFYKIDYQNTTGLNIGTNEFMALASSTISTQFNNLLAQLSPNNVFTVGFDWRRTDQENTEYQVDLIYQPNERWIINGNLGYRDYTNSSNTHISENYNKFITDVDIEYLLTKSGKLRIKAYNHTIDRAQVIRNARNTQGIGVMYKEDFDSVRDLFSYYWRLVTNIGKKEKNEEAKDSARPDDN